MVSAKAAICGPAEPTTAGPSVLKNVFVSPSIPSRFKTRRDACPRGRGPNQQKLKDARRGDAPGGGMAGAGKQERRREGGDDGDVQQDGSRRRRGETLVRVEKPREQRHQRDEQEIGERDAGQRHGEVEFRRIVRKPRRQQPHDPRHRQKRNDEHDQPERRSISVKMRLCEAPRRRIAVRFVDPRVGGHEGGVERALAENGAEVVGQALRHHKGVGDGAGAQHGRHDDIAGEPRDAGDERPAADRQDLPDIVRPGARRRSSRTGARPHRRPRRCGPPTT